MSVQFDGSKMSFDFIQLDVFENGTVDPEFLTKIDYGQFDPTDASAVGMLPVHQLNGVFWYKICDLDLSDNNDTLFAMMPECWPVLRYGDARVTPETAIYNVNTEPMIYDDFVRSIIRDIKGTNHLQLCTNLQQMRNEIISLDSQIHTLIKNKIISVGGTFDAPKHLYDISPAGHLWNALINQEEGIDERRSWFINQINEKKNAYEAMYSNTAFYYYGNDGIHGEGYYYPIYLNYVSGSESIDLGQEKEFFIVGNKKGVPFLDMEGIIDYQQYSSVYYPMEFLKDDIVKIRIGYHHSRSTIYGKTINPRSYMLYLKLY